MSARGAGGQIGCQTAGHAQNLSTPPTTLPSASPKYGAKSLLLRSETLVEWARYCSNQSSIFLDLPTCCVLQQQQRQIQQLMNMLPHFQNQPLNMTLGMMSGRLGPDAATIIPTSLSQTNLAPTDPLSTTATSNPTNIGPTSSGPANVAPVASEPSIHGPVDSGQATNYRARC